MVENKEVIERAEAIFRLERDNGEWKQMCVTEMEK